MARNTMKLWGERARTFFVAHLVTMSLVLSVYSVVSLFYPLPILPVFWILTASVFVPLPSGIIAVMLKERSA